MILSGKRVLVMGLGVHGGGLGVARWLLTQGAQVTVTDMATAEALATPLAALNAAAAQAGATVQYVLGEHRPHDFTSHDILIANPAVRPDSPWLEMARAAEVPIETEMTLFFRACPGPIVGVTGTKGKTTTATLTGALLREVFPDTVLAGNMRVSALEALPNITSSTPTVLELSSFQLVGLGEARLSPQFAAITNLSPDHLNYHGSMEEYARAKQQIFDHQDEHGVAVLGLAEAQSPLLKPDSSYAGHLTTFSLDPSERCDGTIVDGWVTWRGEAIMPLHELQLRGQHNHLNVLAAVGLARSVGVAVDSIRRAAGQFSGVEHRQELVRELDGVRYINDTTATNPAAAVAGLESIPGPLVLIAGGADKGLPLEPLAQALVRHAKEIILLAGSATPRLQAALAEAGGHPAIHGPFTDFAEAIAFARGRAVSGDAVLLSPGCASFGMFKNEFHRGEEFRRIVGGLGEA